MDEPAGPLFDFTVLDVDNPASPTHTGGTMTRRLAFALALVAGSFGCAVSSDRQQPEGATPPRIDEPGPAHALFRKLEGSWQGTVQDLRRHVEGHGQMQVKVVGRGLWMLEDMTGEIDGRRFENHAIVGYDLQRKRYVAVRASSTSSSLIAMESTEDGASPRRTYVYDVVTPEGGKVRRKDVMEQMGLDALDTTCYEIRPDGSEEVVMRFHMTRTGEP